MGRIAEEATAQVIGGRVYTCKYAETIAGFDAEDRAVAEARMQDGANSTGGIARWLATYKYRISVSALQKHRNRECFCYRDEDRNGTTG